MIMLVTRICFSIALAVLANGLAAQTIQASLVATQPLVLSQNGVGQVSHPVGPLTSANLTLGTSDVTVDLTQSTLGWSLESYLDCDFAPSSSNYYSASADMELTLSASAPMRVTLRVYARCQDDSGGYVSVDVPGYGSVAFFNGSSFGEVRQNHFLVDLSSTGLPITISQWAGGAPPPGVSRLRVYVEAWSPLASPVTSGCGGLFQHGFPFNLTHQFDHFVDLVDNGSATSSGTLRARALGQWSSFFVGFSPSLLPFQLPAPFTSTCPILTNIVVATGGTVTDIVGVPSSWELPLPLLPPGMTIYAQHGCAKVPGTYPGNILWNTSNVVRIDT